MRNTKKMLIILATILMLAALGIGVNAADFEDYAPIFYFEGEETCYPIDADFHITNSDLYQFDGETSSLVSLSPTEDDLVQHTINDEDSDYSFLDNREGTVDDYNKIISDARTYESTYGNTVYYKVHTSGSNTVIQYWMFYAFNPGELNQHEGDWEMVQVVIPVSGEKWVAYSQHHSGQQATWGQVEKDGDHIKVYVSRGSHANFLRSYSGKLGMGMGSDYVGANGEVLMPSEYTLVNLDTQTWLDYDGRWGEIGDAQDLFIGRAGTSGPQFREDGDMWSDKSISWGQGLPAASDMMFLLDWFVYNLVMIYVVITVIILALIIFRIYRRHKKYGLGPRKMSLLYIDGLNLKTIGNILCIVGIIIAIIALFSNWYLISGDVSAEGIAETGQIDIMLIDGIEGLKINLLGPGGAMPVGAFVIPFSMFIGVGLVLMIISTIGVNKSSKLGWKYIGRGIRLFVPIIIILIAIMAIGGFTTGMETEGSEEYIEEMLGAISGAPFGGEKTIALGEIEGTTGYVSMTWGFGLGGYLLIFSGIIMLVAGFLEFSAKKVFFEPKIPYKKKHEPVAHQPLVVATPPPEEEKPKEAPKKEKKKEEPKSKSETFSCPKCGRELKKGAKFCADCGEKI